MNLEADYDHAGIGITAASSADAGVIAGAAPQNLDVDYAHIGIDAVSDANGDCTVGATPVNLNMGYDHTERR